MKPLLLALAMWLPVVAAAEYKLSEVNGLVVTNPNVGTEGFRIAFPAKYKLHQPKPKPGKAPTVADIADQIAHNLDRGPGFHTQEVITYQGLFRAIALAVTLDEVTDTPGLLKARQVEDMLRRQTAHVRCPKDSTVLFRKVEKVGDVPVGKVAVTWTEGGVTFVNVLYFTHNTLRTYFLINGVCWGQYADKMMAEMDTMIGSIGPAVPGMK